MNNVAWFQGLHMGKLLAFSFSCSSMYCKEGCSGEASPAYRKSITSGNGGPENHQNAMKGPFALACIYSVA